MQKEKTKYTIGGWQMFITITGDLGSGKSTIAKIIEKKYGFKYYSTGVMQREIAKEKGITTLELNKLMLEDLDNEFDKLIDNKTKQIEKEYKGENVLFDSRMAWHFVEKSFKVYVSVDVLVAAQRVLNAGRGNEETYCDIETAKNNLLERKKVENIRFNKMYNVDCADYGNYDLVIDSSNSKPEQLADVIVEKAKEYWGRV